jgi:hypothetical protein
LVSIASALLMTAIISATSLASATAASSPTLRPAGIGGATRQTYLATAGLQPAGFPESWGLSHRDLLSIGAGLVVVVLLGIVLVLRVRRRRRAAVVNAPGPSHHAFPRTAESFRGSGIAEDITAPLPRFEGSSLVVPTLGPGWYPVQGDATRLAYWDGAIWSAFRQWDGQKWVDPTSINV